MIMVVGSFAWSGGPYFSGLWMLPIKTPLRVAFDPSFHTNTLSVSAFYQRGFAIFNEAYFGFSFKGISLVIENLHTELPKEDQFPGSYNEFSTTLGYSTGFLEGSNLGFSISYFQINTPRSDLGRMHSFGLNIGASFEIYDFWKVGFFSKNINSPETGGISLPTFIGGYISFSPSSDITTSFGVLKDQYSNVSFGLGGIWKIVKILSLIASTRYDGNVPSFYAGFSLGKENVYSDVIITIHPDLPASTFLGINYNK